MKMLTYALVLLCFFALRPAQAFVDPPWITPENPQAGETIYVNLRFGICDMISVEPVPPQITQTGMAVRILLWGSHETDPILCNVPIWTAAVSVGAFPPGAYTLQVDRWYQNGLGVGGTTTETLGVLPFTVEGVVAPPTPVPTLGGMPLFVLAMLLTLFAAVRIRRARGMLIVVATLLLAPAAAPTTRCRLRPRCRRTMRSSFCCGLHLGHRPPRI